jgi:hypothetical protein
MAIGMKDRAKHPGKRNERLMLNMLQNLRISRGDC